MYCKRRVLPPWPVAQAIITQQTATAQPTRAKELYTVVKVSLR